MWGGGVKIQIFISIVSSPVAFLLESEEEIR
jgi:hypothetical protein